MKRLMMLMLAAVAVLQLQAQSLDGRWMAEEEGDDGEQVAFLLEFSGSTVVQGYVAGAPMEGVGSVVVSLAVPAQAFTPGAKAIDFKPDAEKSELDLVQVDYIPEIKEAIKNEPAKAAEVKKIVLAAFEQTRVEMAKETLMSGRHTITRQTADELVLTDPEGDEYIFKRVKK